MDGGYRSPTRGILERLLSKREAVTHAYRELGDTTRALLPDALAERLAILSSDVHAATSLPRELEALAALERGLDDDHATLTELGEGASERLVVEHSPPDPLPSGDPRPFLIEESIHSALRAEIETAVFRYDRLTETERWGDAQWVLRFAPSGAPCVLHVAVDMEGDAYEADAHLTIAVPRALPALALEPETRGLRVRRALGLVREITVGDEAIDREFLIQGPARLARLVTDATRAALLALRPHDVELEVRGGVASIRWATRAAPGGGLVGLASAVELALGARHALTRA